MREKIGKILSQVAGIGVWTIQPCKWWTAILIEMDFILLIEIIEIYFVTSDPGLSSVMCCWEF